MNKLKIRGIIGTPLFLSRFHGYIDGKRGAVTFIDEEWHGHYIENKKAIYNAFVHSLYTELEKDTAPLHNESAALVVEHEDVKEKLKQPDAAASGPTATIQIRNADRISAGRNRLQIRQQEIELRLASIDEELIHSASEAASKHREATALTQRRVQAYLHGASLATRRAPTDTQIDIHHSFAEEEEFKSRHTLNEVLRHAVIESSLKGGAQQ